MSLLRKKLKIMATKTFEELKQLAIQIRDEKTNKQNTATRIGTQMLEHLDKLEQDYYDKTATDEELQARDEKLTELENTCGKIQSHILYPINTGYYYAPFKIKQGTKYTIRVRRINDVNGTVQFKTSSIEKASGLIDTLENLPFSEMENVQSFIASSDANYIASYAANEGIQIVFTLDSTYTNEAIENNKSKIDSEINRAIENENNIQTQITEINNKSKGQQTRNAISNLVNPVLRDLV